MPKWTKNEWYERRDGNKAMYKEDSYGMSSFFHPDIGIYVHYFNGEMMSLPKHREECSPYDIVQSNESDEKAERDEGVPPNEFELTDNQTEVLHVSPDSSIKFITDQIEMLRISPDGFYVRGQKLEQDINEAKTVYETFKAWLEEVRSIYHRGREQIIRSHDPFSIDTVTHKDLTLKIDPAISIQPKYSPEDPKLLIADEPVFGIHLWGASISELRDAAEDEIVHLWKVYVESDDRKLAKDALQLRDSLKSRIKRLS